MVEGATASRRRGAASREMLEIAKPFLSCQRRAVEQLEGSGLNGEVWLLWEREERMGKRLG